ncbi:FlgO family outer membrane protein [Thalassotalea fonticola]|uniref:FlgO family outer membrane protein n=1 Tax=Thalassotalea fonticola TaxID=3065649 RepID=A0ABZ0GRJ0_9GAMM|nr:FlgO family outer membrane protein [Colwelliaceae bacterium S1-1]
MQGSEKEFVLDEWLIYPEKSTIKRNDDLIHLEPKIMEVLVYLINNANRVISREELTEKVWQSKFASDEVITRAISVLRKKLDDTGKVHRFIKTIPKHGYVLEYSNQIEAHALPPFEINNEVKGFEPSINKFISPIWAMIIAGIAILIIIAVLTESFVTDQTSKNKQIHLKVDKFVALDNLPSSEMVARVLSEQLITTLSNSESTKVSMDTGSLTDIENDVEFIISGGVKEINSDYHVSLHFIDGSSGGVLWSQSFAGDKKAWHQLVNNISKTIDYFISVAYKDKLNLKRLSLKNLQAAILIHQARELRFVDELNNFDLSIEILQNANVSYPNEKQILMELALSYLRVNGDNTNPQRLPIVKSLIEQAEKAKYKKGVYWLVKALFLKETNEIDVKEAIELIEKNRLLEPENVEVLTILGSFYRISNRDEQAMTLFSNALAIEPDFSLAVVQQAKLLSSQNNNLQAISMVESFLKKHPSDLGLIQLLVKLYNGNGLFDQAIKFLNKIDLDQYKGLLKEHLAASYYYLQIPVRSIQYYQEIDVSGYPLLSYQLDCSIFTLKQEFKQGTESCILADKSKAIGGKFHYGRNLMLQGKYNEAKQQYKKSFTAITENINAIQANLLITEKVDYIWLLSITGEEKLAVDLATSLLKQFSNSNRMGHLGYGIADVILLLSINQPEEAANAFSRAINDGWLHWYDWRYGGPHPALNSLEKHNNYSQWMLYLNNSLTSQRSKLADKNKKTPQLTTN